MDRDMETFDTYTTSASVGSTATCSKYQPRPHSAGSDESRVQLSPASSERKKPPSPESPSPNWRAARAAADVSTGTDGSGSRSSITAYTRRGLLGHTAIPLAGSPFFNSFHVSPPSVDLNNPPPGPLVGAYTNHGGRRVFQSPA